MFSFATSIVLALAVASVSAHSISHLRRHHAHVARATPPAGWATGYLEPYDTYHTRYLAIDCEGKHNTTTFDLCCHPLLATETLAANRNACCAPGATVACPGESSSIASVTKTSSIASVAKTSSAAAPAETDADDEDCDAEDDTDDEDSDDEDCDDEDDSDDDDNDDEDCADEGDDESSTVVSSTEVPTTTAATVTPTTTPTSTKTTEKATPTTTEAKPTTTTEAKPTTTAEAKPTTTAKATTEAKPTTVQTPTTTTQAATTATTADSAAITGGFGTWFTQNGVAGACGTVHKDTDKVVALQTKEYANGANCGRTVQITDLNNGKVETATVADECPTCSNSECLDMSEGLFQLFEELSVGEMKISWKYVD